jgi:hypothetical protein
MQTLEQRLDGIEALMGQVRNVHIRDSYKVSLVGDKGRRTFTFSYCGALLARISEASGEDYRSNPKILLGELKKAMRLVQPTSQLRRLEEIATTPLAPAAPESAPLRERVQWADRETKLVPDKNEDPFAVKA